MLTLVVGGIIIYSGFSFIVLFVICRSSSRFDGLIHQVGIDQRQRSMYAKTHERESRRDQSSPVRFVE